MSLTPISLLDRLRRADAQDSDWLRLHDVYQPVIRSWLRRVPALGDEADDLTQEVLVILLRELPSFERRRDGSFRKWLREITLNRIRTFVKSLDKRPRSGGGEVLAEVIAQLADPASELTRHWNADHDRYVCEKLLAIVKPDFAATTWQAFTRFALNGESPAAVAVELGISVGAVVQAKHRVLKRLRHEAGDFLDD